MELKKILVGLEGLKAKGKLDLDITGLESNSKNIKEGYMFIAIKGYSVDGHDYINNARYYVSKHDLKRSNSFEKAQSPSMDYNKNKFHL